MIGSDGGITGGDIGFFTRVVFTGGASYVDEQGLFIQSFEGFCLSAREGFTEGLEEVIQLSETERLKKGGWRGCGDKEGLVDLRESEVPLSTEEGFSSMGSSKANLLDGVVRSTAGFLEEGLVATVEGCLVGVTEGALRKVGFCCHVEEDSIEAFLFRSDRGISFLKKV